MYDSSDRDANSEPAEYARFDGPEAVVDPARADVMAYSEYDAEQGVYVVRTADGDHEEYATSDEFRANRRRISLPFILENEYDGMPTEDDFVFVVFSESANTEFDEPQLAARGEFQPLLLLDMPMTDISTVVTPEDEEDGDESNKNDDIPPATETANFADSESQPSAREHSNGYALTQ